MRGADETPVGVLLVDSITKRDAASRNGVVVSGPHAGYCAAAKGHVRAFVQRDARVARGQTARVALVRLDELGLTPAAGQTLQDFIRARIAARAAADKGMA